MPDTNYFWLGGRKIEIEKDISAITIRAASEDAARTAAERAGVNLEAATPLAPGLIRAAVSAAADREIAVNLLRAGDNVVHHVYRDEQTGSNEYLITGFDQRRREHH